MNIKYLLPIVLISFLFSCQFSEEKQDEKTFVLSNTTEREMVKDAIENDLRPIIESARKINKTLNLMADHLAESEVLLSPSLQNFIKMDTLETVWQESADLTGAPIQTQGGHFNVLFPVQVDLGSEHGPVSFQVSFVGKLLQSGAIEYNLDFIHDGINYTVLLRNPEQYQFDFDTFILFVHQAFFPNLDLGEPYKKSFPDLNLALLIDGFTGSVTLTKDQEEINKPVSLANGQAVLVINELYYTLHQGDVDWSKSNNIDFSIFKADFDQHKFIHGNNQGLWFYFYEENLSLNAFIPWSELDS